MYSIHSTYSTTLSLVTVRLLGLDERRTHVTNISEPLATKSIFHLEFGINTSIVAKKRKTQQQFILIINIIHTQSARSLHTIHPNRVYRIIIQYKFIIVGYNGIPNVS
jgi:hypothetical protein